jgi:hypothetical protein
LITLFCGLDALPKIPHHDPPNVQSGAHCLCCTVPDETVIRYAKIKSITNRSKLHTAGLTLCIKQYCFLKIFFKIFLDCKKIAENK